MTLLGLLSAPEWEAPSICGSWRVRDVGAHLLDTMLRRLSLARDGSPPPPSERPLASYQDLVAYVDQLNAEWVRAARRLSPRVIRDLLSWVGPEVARYFATLPPDGDALFPVAWVGEARSRNWMDIGREYTEQWLHQQHIRLAVRQPLLTQRRWLDPVLALFVRALPRAYADVHASPGTTVAVAIRGEAAQDWTLRREHEAWLLEPGMADDATTRLTLSDDDAWRLFSKSLRARSPREVVQVTGDPALAQPLLAARAIMG